MVSHELNVFVCLPQRCQIFLRTGVDQDVAYDTSALPGGNKLVERTLASMMPWRRLVGVELPADDDLNELVGTFFLSVDWFMMVRFTDLIYSTLISDSDLDLGLPRGPLQTQIFGIAPSATNNMS